MADLSLNGDGQTSGTSVELPYNVFYLASGLQLRELQWMGVRNGGIKKV